MVTILWILLAYGSYQIGWQLQLQDPDPKLSDTLQRKCCKWQHLIVFAYLLLFRWAEICQSEQRDVMQITQAYMIGSLLLAAWIDHYIQLIPDMVYVPGLAGGIVWLIYSNPGEDIVINLLIFVAIQMFIFRRLYGGSDCLAYILCAMYLAGCGKDLTDYLLFMLLAVGLELIVQLKNNNINIKEGKLKQPNRDIRNVFGTEKYAYEELVAEISACFMSEHIQIEQTEEHVNNHKAYIQSWTKALSEKPEMLMKAIRDAEKAANYLEYHAEILSKEEYQETLTLYENEETPTPGNTSEKMVEKTANPITREADLKANGYKLTPALKKHMDRLDQLTGRKNSVKDIYKAYKTHDFHGDPETEKTIKSIGKIFQRQEMQIKSVIPER